MKAQGFIRMILYAKGGCVAHARVQPLIPLGAHTEARELAADASVLTSTPESNYETGLTDHSKRRTRELDHRLVEALAEAGGPVMDALAHERLERRDVDDLLARVLVERAQDGQLGRYGLARPRGRAQKHGLVRVV